MLIISHTDFTIPINYIMSQSTTQFKVLDYVPIMDGSNYLLWSPQMKAFLQSQNAWDLCESTESPPTNPGPYTGSSAEALTQHKYLRDLWNDYTYKKNKVIRSITMSLSIQHRSLIDGKTPKETWDELKTRFGTPGPSVVFADFVKVVNFRLSGNNPVAEIGKLREMFGILKVNNVTLDDFIQGMILLQALPPKWNDVTTIIFQGRTQAQITFKLVAEAIQSRYEQSIRPAANTGNHSARKLSAVKRVGPSPNFHQQAKSKDKSSG